MRSGTFQPANGSKSPKLGTPFRLEYQSRCDETCSELGMSVSQSDLDVNMPATRPASDKSDSMLCRNAAFVAVLLDQPASQRTLSQTMSNSFGSTPVLLSSASTSYSCVSAEPQETHGDR